MDINAINEVLKLKDVAESFKASCDEKTKFFAELRGVLHDFAPGLLEKAKLEQNDYKTALEKYQLEHKYDNYQFRYNKKYTTAAIFLPSDDVKVKAHDTLTFRGRKSDKPHILVFEVTREPEEGQEAEQPFKVEIDEVLFKDWLKYDMVH